MPDAMIAPGSPSASARAQNSPLIARLSDSVPPEVKITELGRVPRSAAMRSRASSTMRRVSRPAECSDEGLPTWALASSHRSRAAGSMGVVAA